MTTTPVICFGQQPCGFFPRRFLFAKIQTARRLQAELGGEIVFFCHDSDHDFRETRTTLRHRKTGEPLQLNFAFDNQIQRKFSPLYLKRVPAPTGTPAPALQFRPYVEPRWVEAFRASSRDNVADFCLEMYRRMGLLEGIRVARSSDPAFRRAACDVDDFFVDVPYEGEIVRARLVDGGLKLYKGGDQFVTLPADRLHQGADQPDARHPAALDAVGRRAAPTTSPAPANRTIFARKTRRKSPMSSATPSIGPMKPMPNSRPEPAPLLAFGAHPDDIEFGCGGVVARETRAGRPGPCVVCSRGESGSNGTPAERDRARPRRGRGSWGRRSSSSSSTATPTWRSRPPTRSAGRRDPAVAAGGGPGAEPGREPASGPFPARTDGPRRRPPRPLRRGGGAAGWPRTPSSCSSIMRWRPSPSRPM